MKVADFEEQLLERFPASDAEDWDRVGLSVGDPSARIEGVLCALDPTACAVRAACDAGANVLLTHHPVYLEPPRTITPSSSDSTASAALWAAIARGVGLIALHTNLDRSEEALRFLANELGLTYLGRACAEGYGALLDGNGLSVGDLGNVLKEKLGAHPILWNAHTNEIPVDIHKTNTNAAGEAYGATRLPLRREAFDPRNVAAGTIAYLSGSAGELALDAAARGAHTIVCGEDSYHRLMELINRKTPDNDNLSVIVIGHDVSELPYARFLGHVARELVVGIPVHVLEEGIHWSLL